MYTVDVAKRAATYRIEPGLLATVTAMAAERGETVTDVVIRAFEAYIRHEETPGIVSAAPAIAVTVHTPVREPVSYEEPAATVDCKHPAGSVDELNVCRECGADVW